MKQNIALNIGFPILFLCISIIWTVWFVFDLRKKKLSIRLAVNWLILNIFCLFISVYLLIIGIINSVNGSLGQEFNFINFLTKKLFGLEESWSWILWLVVSVSLVSINISIKVSVKISELNNKVDELNRSLAITKGKLAIKLNEFENLSITELSFEEYKKLLDDKLLREKIRMKYEIKMENLKNKYNQVSSNNGDVLDTQVLLGIKDKNNLNNGKNK